MEKNVARPSSKVVMAEAPEKGLSKGLPVSMSPNSGIWARNADMHKNMASRSEEWGGTEHLTVILFRLCITWRVGKAAFPQETCKVWALLLLMVKTQK